LAYVHPNPSVRQPTPPASTVSTYSGAGHELICFERFLECDHRLGAEALLQKRLTEYISSHEEQLLNLNPATNKQRLFIRKTPKHGYSGHPFDRKSSRAYSFQAETRILRVVDNFRCHHPMA
jgi:hypothetical protein